jgi:hypothetical protein
MADNMKRVNNKAKIYFSERKFGKGKEIFPLPRFQKPVFENEPDPEPYPELNIISSKRARNLMSPKGIYGTTRLIIKKIILMQIQQKKFNFQLTKISIPQ